MLRLVRLSGYFLSDCKCEHSDLRKVLNHFSHSNCTTESSEMIKLAVFITTYLLFTPCNSNMLYCSSAGDFVL